MDYKKILVISDLHMTNGKDTGTGVWTATEDFFWDDDFKRFIEYYQDDSQSLLIINGDLFDFLQVLEFPDKEEKELYGISDQEINYTYGLRCSEAASVFQIDKIFEGHPVFFNALASFIAKGNHVKILKGNHDIQLFWDKVQERIISNLENLLSSEKKNLVKSSLEFPSWFCYIPGKLYVEHGNQYEYTTSFRNFLYPCLPFDYEGVSRQIELDLSSFLVRYFTNRMEVINPLADNIRPLSKYLEEFWKNHPYVFITSIGTAFRYLLKAFSKAKAMSGMKKKSVKTDEQNKELIRQEAAKFYPSDEEARKSFEEKLFKIDEMKAEPILSSGFFRFVWNMIKSPLKGLLWVLPLYALLILPDFTEPLRTKIDSMNESFFKSLLNFLFQLKIPELLLVVIIAIILISIRTWLRKRKAKKSGNQADVEEVSVKIRNSAKKIADMLGVKFVVFGHTHYADINKLSDNSFYFNTGTWMGIFAPEEELYRKVKQFTFFIMENNKGKLLHWNIERDTPEPVIVVDTEIPLTTDEDSIIKIVLSFFKKSG
jgi:UDP-2,3-diacylglucosamine pyrophosphatase LpxH